jgi:hypothetical protein
MLEFIGLEDSSTSQELFLLEFIYSFGVNFTPLGTLPKALDSSLSLPIKPKKPCVVFASFEIKKILIIILSYKTITNRKFSYTSPRLCSFNVYGGTCKNHLIYLD